jgi:hypothetical protein
MRTATAVITLISGKVHFNVCVFYECAKSTYKGYWMMKSYLSVEIFNIVNCTIELTKLTPWSRVLHENLTCLLLVKKFPTFYGRRRFFTAFTSARHLSISWVRWVQSMPPHPTAWTYILILSYHVRLGLPSSLFPAGFPTKIMYELLLSPVRVTPPITIFLIWSTK